MISAAQENCIFFYRKMPCPVFTYSSIHSFMRCKRAFFFRHFLFLSHATTPIPFLVGSLFHNEIEYGLRKYNEKTLEVYKIEESIKEEFDQVKQCIEIYRKDEFEKFKHLEKIKVEVMANFYLRKIDAQLTEDRPLIDIETTYAIPLSFITGMTEHVGLLCGKIDCVQKLRDGTYKVIDHKTTQYLSTINPMIYYPQIFLYAFIIEEGFNLPVNEFGLYFVQKPTIRLKKNEQILEYRQRLREWYDEESFVVKRIYFKENVINKTIQQRFIEELFPYIIEMKSFYDRLGDDGEGFKSIFLECVPSYGHCLQCGYASLCRKLLENEIKFHPDEILRHALIEEYRIVYPFQELFDH